MSRLPSSSKNVFLGSQKIHVASYPENLEEGQHIEKVELHIPGLIDPSDIVAKLHVCTDGSKCVVVTGKAYDEQHDVGLTCKTSTFRVGEIEEHFKVPFNAEEIVPKAVLRIAKDSCGHVTEGILSLEWKVSVTEVPIEIQEC